MTLGEVLQEIDRVQPNPLSGDTKAAYLRQLEEELYDEVIAAHEGPLPDRTREDWLDPDRVLLVPDAFGSIYLHWLQSRIDYELADFGRYNNSNAAFLADLAAYANWYNRHVMPRREQVRYY